MAEHKVDLTGQEFNGLEVLGYDTEKSKKFGKAYYKCRCKECGKEASYRKKDLEELTATCHCGANNPIEKMRMTRLNTGREKAEQYIGYKNDESVVISYNEKVSLETGNTTVNLRCSKCGQEYAAPLTQILRGKYKLCRNCTGKFPANNIEKVENQEFGDYIPLRFDHTENYRSWWECYSISRNCNVIVNYDTMYQSRRNKLAKQALKAMDNPNAVKKPFIFVPIPKDNNK